MSHRPCCCPTGSWGSPLHIPAIKSPNSNSVTISIGDLEVYVVNPTNCEGEKKAIMVLPDVWVFSCSPFAFRSWFNVIWAAINLSCSYYQNMRTDMDFKIDFLQYLCNKLSHDLQCYVVAMDNFRGETRDDHLDDFFRMDRSSSLRWNKRWREGNTSCQEWHWCVLCLSKWIGSTKRECQRYWVLLGSLAHYETMHYWFSI